MRILLNRIIVLTFLFPFFALGHGDGEESTVNLFDRIFSYDPLTTAYIAGGAILFLALFIIFRPPENAAAKIFFFWTIVLLVVSTTFYLAAGTFYKNFSSATGGPVHWHADFRIFKCGEELNLMDPSGLSNRVGTPEVHEHGDKRIHIEGTIGHIEEASLHGFFEVIGGSLSLDKMTVSTDKGLVSMENGDFCPDGRRGALQVFVWRTEEGVASQQKVDDFVEYIISPEALVPPGDCVVFEFTGENLGKTNFICEQYKVAESRGDITIVR